MAGAVATAGMADGDNQVPTQAVPGETRICFPFLNKGVCNFGVACRFRHLTSEHPDAAANLAISGRSEGGQQMQSKRSFPISLFIYLSLLYSLIPIVH